MKKDIFIFPSATFKEALRKLNETAEKTLIVADEKGKLLGTLTDGDIRRYILETGKLDGIIKNIYNKKPIYIYKNDLKDKKKIKNIFLKNKIELIPIVDDNLNVIDFITWNNIFSEKKEDFKQKNIDIPVVIMAGGKGTRLEPFTHVLPKPLIPISKKPIIEHIIDNFRKFGIKKYYLTLNYKGEMVKAYFEGIDKDYEIEYIWEEDFLGTAGSLKFLERKEKGDFIVSNCDVIINTDFSDLVKFHKKINSSFTSITAIQHYKIPYGVVKTKDGNLIEDLEEKPEYIFQINTGVYILNSQVLKYIPENKYFDMPQLIKALLKDNKKVYAYPVNENDYIDIGQWEEYREALKKLEGISNV